MPQVKEGTAGSSAAGGVRMFLSATSNRASNAPFAEEK